MIVSAAMRTDIPAFYSEWFMRRVREGYVLSRNPYDPGTVLRYSLDPAAADVLSFCTKDPRPMLDRLKELRQYAMFWSVTVTPYGRDIEPNVPDWRDMVEGVKALSAQVGARRVHWRYDPVLLTKDVTVAFHRAVFAEMAEALKGHVSACVFSFLDLYEKTRRNFPEGRAPSQQERHALARSFAETARRAGLPLISCCEEPALARYGIDVSGCMTRAVLERALGERLDLAGETGVRQACGCLIGHDIGAYNTCPHGCLYCYANYDREAVRAHMMRHDPDSPLLVGRPLPGDRIVDVAMRPVRTGQLAMDLA
ncbi:MAG: DUF1848 domain-containing protein [Clostridiales bacterium]|nr:DUF1848 domain-containing protein [Clostridiales bacterium]